LQGQGYDRNAGCGGNLERSKVKWPQTGDASKRTLGKHHNRISSSQELLQALHFADALHWLEALNEDGTLRQSRWLKIIGEDYIAKAFEFAHEADPGAELYYNDYSIENESKREGAIRLIRKLQAEGVRVAAIGIQGHDKMDWPSLDQEDAAITAFAKLGIKVNITELDIDVLPRATREQGAEVTLRAESQAALNPYAGGLPDTVQQALAKRYAGLFGVFLKHRDVITRVTFWGVTDGDSWLNNWPVQGRTSYPLLFDRNAKAKPAFDAVVQLAKEGASN